MCLSWEAVTAVGTIGATIVALGIAIFHEHLRSLFWHPSLSISCVNEPPDSHRTTLVNRVVGQEVPCFYFRLRIKNSGNAPARTVEVFIRRVEQQRADGSFELRREFLPLNLLWSHIGSAYYETIPPDVEKHCDLGHVIQPNRRGDFPGERHPLLPAEPDKTLFCLDLVVRPNTGSFLLPPGVYRLEVAAAASNANLVSRVVELNHTGKWFDDEARMLREGVGLRPLN